MSTAFGLKNGFCVLDLDGPNTHEQDNVFIPYGGSGAYGCSTMGISTGWMDTYSSSLMNQWLDITEVILEPEAFGMVDKGGDVFL